MHLIKQIDGVCRIQAVMYANVQVARFERRAYISVATRRQLAGSENVRDLGQQGKCGW